MKHLFIIALSSLVLFSCGGGEEKSDETEKNKEKAAQTETPEKKEIVANAETTIQIDGMVCEHACVSSVKKNILAMEGVTGIEIDFEKDRKVNSCKVMFDDKMLSQQDFINKINEINDGAYKVVEGEEAPVKVEEKTMKKSETKEEVEISSIFKVGRSSSFNVSTSDVTESFFSFSSFFDFFTFGF